MALKNTKKEFPTQLDDLSGVVSYVQNYFEQKGYAVGVENIAGGAFISLTKGGIFKAIAGLKTGLNITLLQKTGAVEASMEVGIFGKQVVATAITMLFAWPVVIPQVIGLIQQNKLDEEAYHAIEEGIRHCENGDASFAGEWFSTQEKGATGGSFCPYCGNIIPEGSLFCGKCGRKLSDERLCPNCGAKVPEDSAFCSQCGTKMAFETM